MGIRLEDSKSSLYLKPEFYYENTAIKLIFAKVLYKAFLKALLNISRSAGLRGDMDQSRNASESPRMLVQIGLAKNCVFWGRAVARLVSMPICAVSL
jgi:hypothetical protein